MAALQPLDDAADRVLGLGVDDEPSLDVVPAPAGSGPRARRRWRFRRAGGKKGIAFWLAVAWLATVAFCAIFATRLPLPDPNRPNVIEIPAETSTPDANAKPEGPAPRPIAGPIMPLVASSVGTDELLGGANSRPVSVDPLVTRTLVKGDPLAAPAGRANA